MTTNAELRAAAARQMKWASMTHADYLLEEHDDPDGLQRIVDAEATADHILATVHVDDDEPVTVESLRKQLAEVTAERDRLRAAITAAFGVEDGETWEITDSGEALITSKYGVRRRVNVTREEMNELIRLRAELVSANIDSGNYRGKCGMCGTANCDMLTDDYCASCEIDRLRVDLQQRPQPAELSPVARLIAELATRFNHDNRMSVSDACSLAAAHINGAMSISAAYEIESEVK